MTMLRDLLLVIGIGLFLTHIAHADELNFTDAELNAEVESVELQVETTPNQIDPVGTNQLRLAGSGIASPAGESLALACVDVIECKTIRFVYFKKANEAYYLGDLLKMPTAPTQKLQKKALRVVVQDFFDRHQTSKTAAKMGRHGFVSFLLLGGGLTIAAFATSGISLIATAAIMGGATGGYHLLTSHGLISYMVSGSLTDVSMTRDTGFNWSIQPKQISKGNFDTILGQIARGKETDDDQQRWSNDARIERKIEKLSRQGVQF